MSNKEKILAEFKLYESGIRKLLREANEPFAADNMRISFIDFEAGWHACATRTVPEGSVVVSAKWLERHAGPEDHACIRCYPHSDMIIDGFSCYYHKAIDVIAAAPEPKK